MTADQLQAEAIYPLSPMQEAMLFQTVRDADGGLYIGQMTCILRGDVDLAYLRSAVANMVARHTALRTGFLYEGVDTPLQFVKPRVAVDIAEEDLRHLPAGAAGERVERFLSEDRLRPFDLSQPPLLRIHLFRLTASETRFVLTRHHIIFDGWSASLLLRELIDWYAAEKSGDDAPLTPSRPYQVFVDWARRQDLTPARQFWRSQLAGFREPSDLSPSRIARGEAPNASLAEEKLALDAGLIAGIASAAKFAGITEATLYAGAWALILGRYSGKDDVVLGLTLSGRPAELRGVDSMVGLFLNTLPVRVAIAVADPFLTWIQALHRQLEEVRQYQHLPLVELRQLTEIAPGREMFDHILVIENYPTTQKADGAANVAVEDYRFIDQTNFPINIGVVMEGGATTLAAVCDPTRYSRQFAVELLENFAATLRSICGLAAGARVADIECLSPEQSRQLPGGVETAREWQGPADVVHAFRESATLHASLTAVKDANGSLSYAELSAASSTLAARLTELGVAAESVVAICAERSLELVVSIVAVLKAGAAWLPLDPADPSDRLESLLRGSGACAVLSQAAGLEKLSAAGIPALLIDAGTARQRADSERTRAVDPLQAAYVIYTSGSTGRPKPVVNHHAGLMNRLLWMQSAYPISTADRVLQKTPYTFDVSVWEFLWPLMYGATLVLAEPGGHRDPAYLRDLIVSEGITVAHFVPSMLRLFLDQPDIEQCSTLRHVISSGEALPAAMRDRFHERLGAQLHNLYGPTEAAIDVTYFDCSPSDRSRPVPIGRPIANTGIYILSPHMRLVPRGVAGEIFIAGRGLARGYHGQPEQTADRFVPDPFSGGAGARLYRTGDLGRLSEAGEIEYIGRTDFQIKIRGMRVEPGEIEATVRSCHGVADCAVLAEESEGEVRLTAHVVPKDPAILDAGTSQFAVEVSDQLRHRLPGHLIPARLVFHRELPLTPSGKLDRSALRRSGGTETFAAQRAMEAPRNEMEAGLAEIWKEVLGIGSVGIRENFFELGGHSLLLAQVSGRVKDRLGVSLPLRDLFNAQTIAQMAEAIMDKQLAEADPEELRLLAEEVQGLSPEEVDRLLAEAE